jgi:hypothetical protein
MGEFKNQEVNMNDVKIDEDALENVSEHLRAVIKNLTKAAEILEDREEDLFIRYLTFFKMDATLAILNTIPKMAHNLLGAGNNIKHEIIQTKKAKEGGWDRITLERNPFFTTVDDRDDDEDESDVSETLKAFFAALKNRK